MPNFDRKLPSYGLDFDGVICGTDELARQWLRTERGLIVPSYEISRGTVVSLIGQEEYDRMCPQVYGELTMEAEPIPGAIEGVRELSERSNLYVVTTRPPERKKLAGQWLAEYDLLEPFVALLSIQDHEIPNDTKLAICQRYGMKAMVDNDPRHLEGEMPDGFKKILLKQGSRGEIDTPDDVILARNWDEVLAALE